MTLPLPVFEQDDEENLASLGRSLKKAMSESTAIADLFNGKRIRRQVIETSLEKDLLSTLKRLAIVEENGNTVASLFYAQMINDKILFSDLPTPKAKREQFFLDPLWEAPTFVYLLAHSEGGNALDVGCGCGVLSIAMADYCSFVIGVDVNPRAIQMSRFNALLNGIKNVTFLDSDLFAAVSNQSFDRIVFNSPTGFELKSRNLLEAGEQILERFFRELPYHLNQAGIAQINLCFKDYQGRPFWQRFSNWLGAEKQEFQILFIELFHVSKGFRFWIGRSVVSIRQWTNAFTVTAVTRGWLTIRKTPGDSFIVSTNYHQWAKDLGSKFSNTLFHWLLSKRCNESEIGVIEEQLIKSQSYEKRDLAQAVIDQFKQHTKHELLSNQLYLIKNS
jgi:predicted RNA methylase